MGENSNIEATWSAPPNALSTHSVSNLQLHALYFWGTLPKNIKVISLAPLVLMILINIPLDA
jgi:hypothetical protein